MQLSVQANYQSEPADNVLPELYWDGHVLKEWEQ